ncbi:MAG: cell division ATP-binding protein FtsE [Nitrospirota bacterium]
MIQMFHVSKYYDKNFPALRDISLEINKGDFVFVMGPSGAGKSTLLKLIFCAERADEGQILIQGRNIARLSDSKIPYLRRNLGVVFQDYKLLQSRTIYENIAFSLKVCGVSNSEIKRRVYFVLKQVGLEHKSDSFPIRLSGGEQQRAAIARAIVNEPAILIADEPTGNLDYNMSVEIFEILKDINVRGTTVIVATHNREIVSKMQRRIISLDKGKIVSN